MESGLIKQTYIEELASEQRKKSEIRKVENGELVKKRIEENNVLEERRKKERINKLVVAYLKQKFPLANIYVNSVPENEFAKISKKIKIYTILDRLGFAFFLLGTPTCMFSFVFFANLTGFLTGAIIGGTGCLLHCRCENLFGDEFNEDSPW